jgi:catechol 2,3-dioxygenase-like lactoylglutathione lyase family enzyme
VSLENAGPSPRENAGPKHDERMRYHHIGIPTREVREEETYLSQFKVFVSGYETSPFGVEWMRFEPGSPIPELVQTVAHVAFEVDDLEAALRGREILIAPNSPSGGVRVAFIVADGAPVELLEIRRS